jgi:hypothetical protein
MLCTRTSAKCAFYGNVASGELPRTDLWTLARQANAFARAAFGTMPHHPESWNRYAFVHARPARQCRGRVAELVTMKARLSEEEAKNLSRGALNTYINSCYRFLKNAGTVWRWHRCWMQQRVFLIS